LLHIDAGRVGLKPFLLGFCGSSLIVSSAVVGGDPPVVGPEDGRHE
jgi:hypothetical protein